jgi:hypothetical protein
MTHQAETECTDKAVSVHYEAPILATLAILPFLCCGLGPGNCPGRICLGPVPAPAILIELGRLLPGLTPPPGGPSNPALKGVAKPPPIPPALEGKFSLVALPGAPIMPIARLRLELRFSVPEDTVPKIELPPCPPRALRSMSFMRMYWYLLRCETG